MRGFISNIWFTIQMQSLFVFWLDITGKLQREGKAASFFFLSVFIFSRRWFCCERCSDTTSNDRLRSQRSRSRSTTITTVVFGRGVARTGKQIWCADSFVEQILKVFFFFLPEFCLTCIERFEQITNQKTCSAETLCINVTLFSVLAIDWLERKDLEPVVLAVVVAAVVVVDVVGQTMLNCKLF